MRPDKVTLAGVAATLALYRAGRAAADIPVWRMIALPSEAIRERAAALASVLGGMAEVVETEATVGGGSLPGETLASYGLAVNGGSAARLLAVLRRGNPSVVGRISEGRVVLDLRTVDPASDRDVAAAVAAASERR
jgi:L-seryl-tRNA(Ser) seleniumtransferase